MFQKIISRSAALLAAAVVSIGAGNSASYAQEVKSTLQEVQERGVLRAGVRYDYPPNGFMTAAGEVKGYGPDVARAFAKRLGVKVEFVQTTSSTRIPLLLNKQIDADFGPTTPSKSRDEVVDFSHVWNVEGVVVVVRKGQSLEPKDYYGGGKVIGATQGAIFIELWKKNDPEAKFKLFQEYPQLLLALSRGQVDAALLNQVQAVELVKKMGNGELEVGKPFFQDPSAIMVRENDSNWRDWINWALQRMWNDGELQALYREYYGEPQFHIWQNGMLQPGVMDVGKEGDPWNK